MGLEIGKTVDGYEIVEILGSSKTGVAYKVRNVFAQRFEVLKILPKSVQDDEEQAARFLREIKVHAQLLHPNIVTFYNARQMEGQLVMTTEFVPGATIAERLEAGPIEWREACHYGGQVLSALGYAHAHGIVHRGLSSSNLILTPEGNVRLTGFGLAKSSADPELTAAGSVIGTLKYMAPEQVKGEHIDARSDLYSMGILLYEMLTGKLPFAAKGQFEIMLAHVNTAPKHASDVNAEVPRELGDAVAKVLAKSPDERFQSAQEFRGVIEHISGNTERKPEAPAPVAETQPAPTQLETAQPLVDAVTFNVTPAPVSSSEPWDAWSFDTPLVAPEPKPAAAEPVPPLELEQAQPVFEASTFTEAAHSDPVESKPVVEFAGIFETPAPAAPNVLWDAHAIEAALRSAEPKAPSAEPAPAQPVSDASTFTETPALASASLLSDAWPFHANPAPAEPPTPAVLEIAEPLGETAASTETTAPVSPTCNWDAWSINPNPAPVELQPAPAELQPEQPAVEAATSTETPAPVSSGVVPDWWAVESTLASAESKLTLPESQPAPSELETVTQPIALPAAHHDPWAIESSASPVESAPAEAELATPPPVAAAVADTPAESSLFGSWMSEWSPAPPESRPEPSEPKLLTAALETPPLQTEPSAAALPDFWVQEPAQSLAEPQRESTELELLSAALEPSKVQAEAPPALPSTPQEPWAIESQPPVVELANPTSEPEPVPAMAAAVASAPDPVVKAVPVSNPDLLTALFGDTLLSRLSLALVVCAITFFLGTVTLFAVLSVTKP